jgi:hypothetical protein
LIIPIDFIESYLNTLVDDISKNDNIFCSVLGEIIILLFHILLNFIADALISIICTKTFFDIMSLFTKI